MFTDFFKNKFQAPQQGNFFPSITFFVKSPPSYLCFSTNFRLFVSYEPQHNFWSTKDLICFLHYLFYLATLLAFKQLGKLDIHQFFRHIRTYNASISDKNIKNYNQNSMINTLFRGPNIFNYTICEYGVRKQTYFFK